MVVCCPSALTVLELARDEAGGELGIEEICPLAAPDPDATLSELPFRDLFALRVLPVEPVLALEATLALEVVLALEDLRYLFLEPPGL